NGNAGGGQVEGEGVMHLAVLGAAVELQLRERREGAGEGEHEALGGEMGFAADAEVLRQRLQADFRSRAPGPLRGDLAVAAAHGAEAAAGGSAGEALVLELAGGAEGKSAAGGEGEVEGGVAGGFAGAGGDGGGGGEQGLEAGDGVQGQLLEVAAAGAAAELPAGAELECGPQRGNLVEGVEAGKGGEPLQVGIVGED